MTDLNDKLHQYAMGNTKGCQHPINKVMPINDYKDVCVLCGKMFVMAFHEEDFNPATMTRATPPDIFHIWRKLWGYATDETILWHFEAEYGEYLDLTQKVTDYE